MPRTASPRRLRHLRRLLGLLAAGTALLVAAAIRLESAGRAVAAVGALACLIAWLAVLEAEGRMAERLERRGLRRRPSARTRPTQRPTRREAPRKVA